MIKSAARFILTIAILMVGVTRVSSQTTLPEILQKGTLSDQMNYLEERTRIYENYRAIREDMFQLMKTNVLDTIKNTKNNIAGLAELTATLSHRIDSLKNSLNTTKEELKETYRTKNNINVLGIGLNKVAYNTIMWMIVLGLALLLVIGFLAFKRNLTITLNTKKELAELKTEFEEYRKKTRLEREKMSMDHFNEIRKLRGG